jgi:hypothetical protein
METATLSIDLPESAISASQINLPNIQNPEFNSFNNSLPNFIPQTITTDISNSQLTIPLDNPIDTSTTQKKKRNRTPKNAPKDECNDSITSPAPKRGRKPKTSSSDQELINISASAIPTSTPSNINNPNSALSQLTQFANTKLDPTNKFLPNSMNPALATNPLDSVNIKQLLDSNTHQFSQLANKGIPFPNQLLSQQQADIIARQATLNSNDKSK